MTDSGDSGATRQVDDLYALPPERFTAARDELARTLRSSGDKAAASAVKKLRRPTVVAWTLNQLVRRHREQVDALLHAGEGLRQAQRKALSGLGAVPMREAQQRRRAVVDELSERAAALLQERGAVTEAHLTAVRRALEAASVGVEAATALVEGRLSQPPEAATGFDSVDGLSLVAEAGTGDESEAATAPQQADAQRRADAQRQAEAERRADAQRQAKRLAAARQAEEAAKAEARARQEEADRAARAASEANAAVERLTRDLQAARKRARGAEAYLRQTAAAAREAADTADLREQERRAAEEEHRR